MSLEVELYTPRGTIPDDAFLNVQSYLESNIKNGLQFEFSSYKY